MKKIINIILFLLPICVCAQSNFRLPPIISDHAVLAENSLVKLWGWAPGNSKIRVVCDWSFWDTVTVSPDRACLWEAVIRTPKAGGSHSIRFFNEKNKLEKEIKDILIGQVWLCSGQSNTEQNADWGGVLDAGEDYASTGNSQIRFFQIYPAHSTNPLDICYGEWKICDEKTAKDFNATGYLFGRRLNEKLKIPIGLIGSSWGGTCIQAWTPAEVYDNNSRLGYMASKIKNGWNPVEPGVIYNAMIHPLIRYRINGTIWYQGDENIGEASDYGELFKGMIQGWRRAFDIHFPFYYVRIAPRSGYQDTSGTSLREQQENESRAFVRYCFTNDVMPELFEINGLLLKPFRTDKPQDLKFNNQKFRIIQFTDLHWNCAPQYDLQNDSTETLIRTLVKEEKPDLIVFTGDVVIDWDAIKAWTRLSNILKELQIPFVVTFGNHDVETNMKKKDILEFLQQNPYNLTYNAIKTTSGIGNCVIPVKSSDGLSDVANLFFFDSNAYTGHEPYGFYDWVREDQVHWYRTESDRIFRENRRILPAMAFFHIPVPEYEIVRKQSGTIGNIYEQAGSPVMNSGLFTSFIEKKNVMATFVGHEHNNDYIGTYADVSLAYGRKSGYVIAYEEKLPRGARIIEMIENKRTFSTYIRTLDEKLFEYNYEK